jgi:hypothetical protein
MQLLVATYLGVLIQFYSSFKFQKLLIEFFQNLETIGTPFAMAMFALSSADTVKTLSIAHSVSGLMGFLCYMVHAFNKKEIIDYRKLLILAYFGFLLFHVLTIPLPIFGKIKTYSAKGTDLTPNFRITQNFRLRCLQNVKFYWS